MWRTRLAGVTAPTLAAIHVAKGRRLPMRLVEAVDPIHVESPVPAP